MKFVRTSSNKGRCLYVSRIDPSHPLNPSLLTFLLILLEGPVGSSKGWASTVSIKVTSNNLGVSNLHKSKVVTMSDFWFSHLPMLVLFLLKRKERVMSIKFIKLLPYNYSGSHDIPLHLQLVPDIFPSMLGSTVYQGTFSTEAHFLTVEAI